jgi:cytidylate kinase
MAKEIPDVCVKKLDKPPLLDTIVITISGPAGSGKSFCASSLATYFGIPYHSAGSIFRQMAAERGVTIEELTRQANIDPTIDKEIDSRTNELAKGGGIILEGRLVTYFTSHSPHTLSFYLTAPFEERVKRIADREGSPVEVVREKTRIREESELFRYKSLYGFDISDLSIYDFVINTSIWDKESEVQVLKKIVDIYLKSLRKE